MSDKTAGITMMPIEKIHPSKTNPRKHFDEVSLKEMAETMKIHGILEPVLVRKELKNGGFELVAGERRLRAAILAGLKEIPVIEKDLTDEEVLEIHVIENMQREGLHPLEEAEGYRQLLQLPKPHKYDAAKIAARVGRSVKYVYDRIKLMDLTPALQKDFTENKITAGHAILLARLTTEEQKKVSDKDTGGLWKDEDANFEEIVGKSDGFKLCSVRELQQYIDEHVRFVPERDADPMLFPETAAVIQAADPKKKSDKIVAITYGYVNPDARNGEHHIAPTSWKRADGKKGSKTCEFSVIGVVCAGEERAQAFRVCTNKEKCKTHWSEWQKARAKSRASSPVNNEGASAAERQQKEREKQEVERKQAELESKRWDKALPDILKALAVAFKKAPIAQVAKELIKHLDGEWLGGDLKKAEKNMPAGKSADEILRHAAYWAILLEMDNNMSDEDTIQLFKTFGVDVKKIIDDVAPIEKKEAVKETKKFKLKK
jgi:ParB/RepB/Spo0J family partition protein